MSKVLFGDVVIERRETCKTDKAGLPSVGLEHLIPERLRLTSWDESGTNTFTKIFRKGDVLFGRRRTYLKKAAAAEFDGICSGDITVIMAKPDVILPELLPFVIQNNAFFSFAVGRSAGSLSPRVRWRDLKEYEFELPDMNTQKKLADVLWAINDTIEAYSELMSATDDMVKVRFMEIMNESESVPVRMGDVATYINGYAFKPDDWKEDGLPIVRIQNLNDRTAAYNYYSGQLDDKYLLHTGDVIVSWSTHLEVYMWNRGEAWLNQHIFRVIFDKIPINKYFFTYSAQEALRKVSYKVHGSTMKHIKRQDFENAIVDLIPMRRQEQFAEFARQAEESKSHLEQALLKLKLLSKKIIRKHLNAKQQGD